MVKTLKSWWASAKYYVIFILLGVAGIVYFLLSRGKDEEGNSISLNEVKVPDVLMEKADKAYEESLVAKAKVKVRTEVAEKKLEEIAAVDDKRERIRKLAAFLDTV